MSDFLIRRREDHHEMPWRNGQGSTLQVMTAPPGAGLADFDWRVSFARVERPGAFSRFEGIDRVITLVDGADLRLSIDDGSGLRVVELRPHEPFAFAGEDEVSCQVSGPTLDLNLMTRRGRVQGEVRTVRVGPGPVTLSPAPGQDLLVAVLAGEMTVLGGGVAAGEVGGLAGEATGLAGEATGPATAGPGEPVRLAVLDVLVEVQAPLTLEGEGMLAVLRMGRPVG